MSFVGKILIVVQVVMSVCFMAFAGAVYVTQDNWKDKHAAAEQAVAAAKAEKVKADADLNQVRDELAKVARDAEQEVDRWKREAQTQTQLANAKTEELNQLNTQKEQVMALISSKETEAANREKESEVLRSQNSSLQTRVNEGERKLSTAEDNLFNSNVSLTRLQQRYDELLQKSSFLERVVALHKLETNPAKVREMQMPAPPLDGVVREIRLNATGRTQFVVTTVGSDDGLRVGHELDAFRIGNGDSKTLYLGKIRIIEIFPDSAVGEVVQSAKNGNIEVGDNVTTAL